jgi:hypothetical protein
MTGSGGEHHDSRAWRDPATIQPTADRAHDASHELSRMLSESLGWLHMARRSLSAFRLLAGSMAHADWSLSAANVALDRINDLVHAAMQGPALGLGSPLLAECPAVSLRDAVQHAAEACRGRSDAQGTEVLVRSTLECGSMPSGCLYAVVLGLIRAGLDSIGRAGGEGRLEVLSWIESDGTTVQLCVDVRDDGLDIASRKRPETEDNLAMACTVAREFGGSVVFLPTVTGEGERRGVTARVRCPAEMLGSGRSLGRRET